MRVIVPFTPRRSEPRFVVTDAGNIYDTLDRVTFTTDDALHQSQVITAQAEELRFKGPAYRAASNRLMADRISLFDAFSRAKRPTVAGGAA